MPVNLKVMSCRPAEKTFDYYSYSKTYLQEAIHCHVPFPITMTFIQDSRQTFNNLWALLVYV